MNKRLPLIFNVLWISSWLSGCASAATPVQTSSTQIPTSTVQVPTLTPAPTITLIAIVSSTPELLPISAEASAYLEEALDVIQNNSLQRQSTDWDELRRSTFKVAQYAQTPEDTYGAIRYALGRLGDHHSFFMTPQELEQREQQTESDSPAPRGKLLLDKIGFIAIERYTALEGANYATEMQGLIREIDAQNPCGWIVDLRENTGGNMGPMLAGIGPILGEGNIGAFIDSYGNKEVLSYQDGQVLLDGELFDHVNGPAYRLKVASPPVAVLTGVNTASAGEVVVIAFRGRPNTRSFGLYTSGLSTPNQGFHLSDGALIILTTAVDADRTGQTYGDKIYPDEIVDDVSQFTFLMEEAIPQPAIDWLMSQPVCHGSK